MEKTKQELKTKEKQLLEMVAAFCSQKLNDEYFVLCEKLIQKMGRKRDVPFQSGKLEIWAAAVVCTIGSINFLFDKATKPYLAKEEIHTYFGTKNTTVSAKSAIIKKMFDLWYFNPEFSTRRMNDDNPFNKLVMVDDLIVPIDTLPSEMQEIVKQERAKGKDVAFYTKDI